MLPKQNRLPAFEITSVMKRGKRISSGPLVLVYQANQLGVSRFAFIVSTNIDKRATVRNRVKRLLREAVRKMLPGMKVHIDGTFLVKGKFADTMEEVKQLVSGMFERI